ncbi:helix-turn-helix domain-containing protein [Anaerosporobacter sp.]|uniref:helix-turn-helix domain-containing protein n=1 Tax=Anaerosporobacter sp. TaxID=1872529 RepID=UPI00286F1EFA|nr:helix-turn-helix transcriptional regulator [Anaerosporobacter sp.]
MRKSHRNLSDFSLRLKHARDGIYTQQQLSDASHVNLKTIQRLEGIPKEEDINNEPKPLASNLLSLAQALDVTPEYLLFGEENMDIYMNKLKEELIKLTIADIHYYHKQKLTDKVLPHLKLTDSFIDSIHQYWNDHTLKCYRPYVQDTIIRYCHNRPPQKKNI